MATSNNLFKPIAKPTIDGCVFGGPAKPVPVSMYSEGMLAFLKTRANVTVKNGYVYIKPE